MDRYQSVTSSDRVALIPIVTVRARRAHSQNLTNSCLQNNLLRFRWLKLCQFCLSNLILLCSARSMLQTTPAGLSFSLVNTAAITFSCWPFHTFHSHLASLSIQLCRWWFVCGCVCMRVCAWLCVHVRVSVCVCLPVCARVLFNNSHLPARSPESFVLQSAAEFIERFGIQAIRKRNTIIDLSKLMFFFPFSPAKPLLGSGALHQNKNGIEDDRKKDVWQGAWFAIYEMDWGHWVLGGKWAKRGTWAF